jgi:protein-S-isoprenylcysteine O-methyltransferase Ste14
MVLLKTIIFTFVVPGTVTLLVPYSLLSSRLPSFPKKVNCMPFLGVFPMLLGASIYFWCAWDFTFAGRGTPAPIDPPKTLVVRGLYRYVRNPMYVGVFSILLGEALFFESRTLLVYAAVVFFFFYLFVVLYEEPILRQKFGESYQKYCQSVPRWLPWRIKAGRTIS